MRRLRKAMEQLTSEENKIVEFLKGCKLKFPNMRFKFGKAGFGNIYVVEVLPLREFKCNEEYGRMEMDFIDKFESENDDIEVIFVSSENAMRIKGDPIFSISE